jgi:hypothetical protein
MISLDKATEDWARIGEWKIAPAGLSWITEGARARIVRRGNHWRTGNRKCIAQVNGVAYIGAGCRWFTLSEAIIHWNGKADACELTLCQLESAKCIARLRGWEFTE